MAPHASDPDVRISAETIRRRKGGVPIVCLGRRPGRDWRVVARLARELRRRRIDVIHAHQYTPFFYSALARVLARGRPRLMFTEHGRHFPDVVGRTRRLLNRWLLARLSTEINDDDRKRLLEEAVSRLGEGA